MKVDENRLFLEDLSTKPDAYRHAMILNLHGDVLPMPAIRNYSDAASDPIGLPNLRCVTHPERLHTRRDPATQPRAVAGRDHSRIQSHSEWRYANEHSLDRDLAWNFVAHVDRQNVAAHVVFFWRRSPPFQR